jgi:hypothetical protein
LGHLGTPNEPKKVNNTLFRKPIEMAFFNIQVLLKSSEIPEIRNNQQSGFTEKF